MAKINTVSGTISSNQMGSTLMHEHMVYANPGWDVDSLCTHFELGELASICAKALVKVKEHGVKTVVDATAPDMWRNVELDKIVSDKTGINIICATGMFYETGGMPAYWKFRGQALDIISEMYESFMRELTLGIGNSGVKAGAIKVGTGNGAISAYEEKVLKAAAKAQKETGVPIITHTENGTMGPEQAALLIGEGVNPHKIVIGHMCGNPNIEYQLNVINRGSYAGFDRWGIDFFCPDSSRKTTILELLRLGHANHIVMSHDANAQIMGRPLVMPDFLQALIVNWNYTHVFEHIIPQLLEAGVTAKQVDQMLVDNPRDIFFG